MKPDEMPCYFCGKTDKIRSTIQMGGIPMKAVICKTCTNVALFLPVVPGTGREVPKESLPPEVKRKAGDLVLNCNLHLPFFMQNIAWDEQHFYLFDRSAVTRHNRD